MKCNELTFLRFVIDKLFGFEVFLTVHFRVLFCVLYINSVLKAVEIEMLRTRCIKSIIWLMELWADVNQLWKLKRIMHNDLSVNWTVPVGKFCGKCYENKIVSFRRYESRDYAFFELINWGLWLINYVFLYHPSYVDRLHENQTFVYQIRYILLAVRLI